MRYLIPLILLCTALAACNSDGVNSVTDAEYQSVVKLRSGQYTLISNQDLNNLDNEAALGKSVGRYQIHNEGFRTWRLDTATGQICLLLASSADWKKPDISAQGCLPTAGP